MITSDCPQQQAFIFQLNNLFDLYHKAEILEAPYYDEIFDMNRVDFVNRWCPTFKQYKGAHITEKNIGSTTTPMV